MKLWKIALFALTVFAASCSIQKTSQPSVEITHVLAITQAGDTIALPMSAIRPVNYRVNYNYPIGYNYYGPWYSPNNVLIYGSRSASGRSSNSSSNINKKITSPSNNKSMEKPKIPASENVNINKGRN
jgi:hypothetical protein